MKLEKAIEILSDCTEGDLATHPSNFLDALKLGIEALKRVQDPLYQVKGYKRSLLPGETED